MKTMKAMVGLVLAMGSLALWGAVDARADTNTGNDSDSLTITMTPSVDLGVDVDTATAVMEGGTDLSVSVALGATAYMTSPAAVTILGNFNNQEVELSAAGLDSWTVDEDEVAEKNKVQVYALFAVAKASRPVELEFGQGEDGRHQVTGSAAKAGEPQGAEDDSDTDNQYEIAGGDMLDGTSMDNLAVGTQKQLWIRVDAPPESDWDLAQQVQVTLTAVTGRLN